MGNLKRLAALAAVLVGTSGSDCGGKSEVNREEWRIRGTYRVTEYLCGLEPVTGTAELALRITPPNTYEWAFTADGLAIDIRIAGEACTWGGRYDLTYTSSTTVSGRGGGTYACTPSDTACHAYILLTNRYDVCGQANSESSGMRHTAVPELGGTLDIAFLEDTWCRDNAYTGNFTFRAERIE